MRHSWFGEDRIVMLLAERERGERTADVCRRHGSGQDMVSKWKAGFGGLGGVGGGHTEGAGDGERAAEGAVGGRHAGNAVPKDLLKEG